MKENNKKLEIAKLARNYIAQQGEIYGEEMWLDIEKDWSSLDEMYRDIKDCQKCPLGASRTKFVFGTGNPNAKIVINPSLWSAPVEGALLKSIKYNGCIAIVPIDFSFKKEIPSDTVIHLHSSSALSFLLLVKDG